MTYDFVGKKIAVVGMARSGMAAADVLSRRGAEVTLYDGKGADTLGSQIQWATEHSIKIVTSAEAVSAADIAVVSPGVRIGSPIISSILQQEIELWGEIEAAWRVSKAPILAVTGTNGKTTTALLLAEMIRSSGITAYAAGNIAAGSVAMPLITAADVANVEDAIVAEISSFQLETIVKFRPAVASILNITPDHQDRQTWTEYVASKWRLFENQQGADTAVLSSTVPVPASYQLPERVVYFDTQPMPHWIGDILLPGHHNRMNVLAAATMARAFGVPESAIKQAALTFRGVVHRLEYVIEIDGVTYINNSMCTNNAAYASSLSALAGPKIVISGGVFKGGDMSPIAEALAENSAKLLVAFGRSAVDLSSTVKATTNVPVQVVENLSAAVKLSSELASPGDTVILNPGCASFDQFRDFEHRGDDFKIFVDSLRKVTSR